MDEGMIRCPWAEQSAIECAYHDRVWGVPLRDERALFGMLCLEGMQAVGMVNDHLVTCAFRRVG